MPDTAIPPPESPPDDEPRLPGHWGRLRPRFKNRILTGLIFIVPLGITAGVAWWIYTKCLQLSHLWVAPLIKSEELPSWINPAINFAGVVVTLSAIVALLWVIGSLSSSFLLRRLVRLMESVLLGLPGVRWVYAFTKQVMQLIAQNRSRSFQRVVIIEYPKERSHVLAFATGETRLSDSDELHVTLFVPTTPNPTSGFMLALPQSEVREARLTVEEAVRIIMSGGIIVPETIETSPYRAGAAASSVS